VPDSPALVLDSPVQVGSPVQVLGSLVRKVQESGREALETERELGVAPLALVPQALTPQA
jgi:hypothetical protein